MFFTSPKSQIKELLHFLHKKYKYNRDLLHGKRLEQYLQLESEISASLAGSGDSADVNAQYKTFEERATKLFPDGSGAATRENIEVFFVAVVIALALRTFFLQPFVIPTDSMKPTLFGIQSEASQVDPPGFFQQVYDFLILGNTYVQVRVEKGGMVKSISSTGWFGVDLLGHIPFVDRTRLVIGDQTYIFPGTPQELEKGTVGFRPGLPLMVGMEVQDNSTPVNYVFGAGDHVFVNKFSYHFRKPNRGDVFVFTTENIKQIQDGLSGGITSQFYIKRCVGLPGDTLEVRSPYLLNGGKNIDAKPIFKEIFSGKNGYQGYGTKAGGVRFLRAPGETYQVPKDSYWAMGDNSYNSYDSRFWGVVPAENLVGTGLLVYWPFSKRWGLIP